MLRPNCIALIADLVRSRAFSAEKRSALQETLHVTLASLNQRYGDAILSRIVVTTGDEFQALLRTAAVLPDLVWDLEEQLPVRVRIGVGLGPLSTKLQEDAIGMDGPAWHAARAAILAAKERKRLGGVFLGFGVPNDDILNGLARLLHHFRQRLTLKQRATLGRLRMAHRQSTLAKEWNLSKQAIHERVKALKWEVYEEGERAWRSALANFDYTTAWKHQ